MAWRAKVRRLRRRVFWLLTVLAVCSAYIGMALPWAGERSRYIVDDRRSGYMYLSAENQRLQDDDFANPGLLWVERGRELWRQTNGSTAQSCASCHGDAADSMRGVRTRYPRFDPPRAKLINLEQQINRCREEHMQATPYPYESEPLLDLTAFVGLQSRGMPID